MKINKKICLNVLGSILILSSILRIIILSIYDNPINILWLSNHVPLIMGIAILMRSSFWILAELSLLFIGNLGWNADYLSKLFFNKYLFGSTEYLFSIEITKTLYFSSLSHLIIIPMGLLAFIILGKKAKNAWVGSILHTLILIPAILYFGKKYNLNCFFESCISWMPTIKLFPIVFPVVYTLLCVIPIYYLLNKLVKN